MKLGRVLNVISGKSTITPLPEKYTSKNENYLILLFNYYLNLMQVKKNHLFSFLDFFPPSFLKGPIQLSQDYIYT